MLKTAAKRNFLLIFDRHRAVDFRSWRDKRPCRTDLDTARGLVTFATPPDIGTAVTAGFEFDVPVRFDSDTHDVTLDFERLGSITAIPLLEIRR